jgi:hypothetical protein
MRGQHSENRGRISREVSAAILNMARPAEETPAPHLERAAVELNRAWASMRPWPNGVSTALIVHESVKWNETPI